MQVVASELLERLERLEKAQGGDSVNSKSFIFHSRGILSHSVDNCINAPFHDIGTFAVPGKKILSFLKKNKTKTFDIVLTEDAVTLKTGKKEVSFAIEPVQIDVSLFLPEENLPFTKVSKNFMNTVIEAARVCPKHKNNSTSPELMFVYINDSTVMASDSVSFLESELETSIGNKYLLKASTLLKYNFSKITEVGSNHSFLFLRDDEGYTYGLLPSTGKYEYSLSISPMLDTIFKQGDAFELSNSIEESLEDIISLCDSDMFMVKLSHGTINTSYKQEGVEYKAEYPVEYVGEDISFNIDPVVFKNSIIDNEVVINSDYEVLGFRTADRTHIVNFIKG